VVLPFVNSLLSLLLSHYARCDEFDRDLFIVIQYVMIFLRLNLYLKYPNASSRTVICTVKQKLAENLLNYYIVRMLKHL
jgi:hypothetical protein